jgi:hypothetical protein
MVPIYKFRLVPGFQSIGILEGIQFGGAQWNLLDFFCILLDLSQKILKHRGLLSLFILLDIVKGNRPLVESSNTCATTSNRPFPLWVKFRSTYSTPGQKFHHNLKEHHKISNIPKFRFSVILHYKREIDNQFDHLIINFLFVIPNDWKTANFARLYYPHFTTFRNETSEYY